jgi:lysophospholipase L1-like esterase
MRSRPTPSTSSAADDEPRSFEQECRDGHANPAQRRKRKIVNPPSSEAFVTSSPRAGEAVPTSRRAALGLVVASTVAALVALEVLLRVLGYYPTPQSGWMIGSAYLTADADLIVIPRFLLAPAFYERHDDRPLVVGIGDSFTQGFPVEHENTYPEVLRRRLESDGLRVDVANAGMGDSGPDQQLRLLETRLVPRLHPQVVIWTLYSNDLWDNALKSTYTIDHDTLVPTSGATHWINVRQRLVGWMPRWFLEHVYAVRAVVKAMEPRIERLVPPEGVHDPPGWGMRKLALELAEFERLARAERFVGYVVLISPQARYLDAVGSVEPFDRWSIEEHRKLSALLDGRPNVIDAWFGPQHAGDIFDSGDRDPSGLGDRHFNEAGYGLLANEIAARLERDAVFAAPSTSRGSPASDRPPS